MKVKEKREASMAGSGCCYFHPKEVIIGVCPLCLHERLLVLLPSSSSKHSHSHSSAKSFINLFAIPSLLNLIRQSNSTLDPHSHDLPTQEDSFISMKFENNGAGSWENNKRLVGHAKSRDLLRWRKRIGHMLHLITWKKRSNVCHVGTKVEGVKTIRKKHK